MACSNDSQGESSDQATAAPAAVEIAVAQFKYTPARLEIAAGGTVRWLNSDEILHTATAGAPGQLSGAFDGEMPGAGTAFQFTFSEPGSYTYFCSRHDFMTGEVVVS